MASSATVAVPVLKPHDPAHDMAMSGVFLPWLAVCSLQGGMGMCAAYGARKLQCRAETDQGSQLPLHAEPRLKC